LYRKFLKFECDVGFSLELETTDTEEELGLDALSGSFWFPKSES
jgi:hypothetical protein